MPRPTGSATRRRAWPIRSVTACRSSSSGELALMNWAHVLLLLLGLALAGWTTGRRLWYTSRSVLVIRPLMALVLVAGAVTGPVAGSSAATIALGLLVL